MIVIILCAAIGAGLCAFEYTHIGEVIVGALLGALVGVVLAMFVGMFVYSGTVWEKQERVELQSLVDGSSTEGQFFLGSGVINDVSTFTWYEKSGDNSYVQERAYADDSIVHFSEEEPHYVRYEKTYEDQEFFQTWGVSIGGGQELDEEYHFYVPEGSIVRNFELDAK
jgi:hypothetical protein